MPPVAAPMQAHDGPTQLGHEVSLTRGGPLFLIERQLHLLSRTGFVGARLLVAAIALSWLPLILIGFVEHGLTGHWDALLTRSEAHVRLLAVVPLFLLGELWLERRVRSVTRHLVEEGIIAEAHLPTWQGTIARLLKLRDAWTPELSLLGLVYAISFVAYLGFLPFWVLRWLAPTIHEAGAYWTHATPATWWYLLVAQPLFLFVFARWLVRWCLFAHLIWGLARLKPHVHVGHADRAGGLGFLAEPLFALRFFMAGTALALMSVWLDEIASGRAQAAAFTGDVITFVVLSGLLCMLPYLSFIPYLTELRAHALLAYSGLMGHYVREFDERWTGHKPPDTEILGHPDFSGLADLGTSFNVASQMRVIIPGPEHLKAHLIATLAPFSVLVLVYGPSASELLKNLLIKLLEG